MEQNKKYIACFLGVFVLGTAIGIISVINEYGDGFERIPRTDMEFGNIKVFFISSFAIILSYAVLLVSSLNNKTVYIALIPFAVYGLYFGKYITLLTACYGSTGILCLIFVYAPFFLAALVFFAVCVILALNACECRDVSRKVRPALIVLAKGCGVHIAVNFVIFVVIGAMTGVVIVAL